MKKIKLSWALAIVSLGLSTSILAKPLMYRVDNFSNLSSLPGFSIAAPSGLVASKGVGFAAFGGYIQDDVVDGALSFGAGFGDPVTSLGGHVSLGIGSINPTDGGAFNRGSLNASVGHTFADQLVGVSIGLIGLDLWHDEDPYSSSFYSAVSKLILDDKMPMVVSAGFGNNGFADRTVDESCREETIGFFASSAIYVIPQLSVLVDYTGGYTTVGVSASPFPDYPITFALGVNGLLKEYDDETLKFQFSASTSFPFLK